MEIKKAAVAGTMESSDCMVTIRPGDGTIDIQLDSDVKVMFGDSILATVRETLAGLGVTSAEVDIRDRGALDCVIRARVECAVCRAAGEAFNWKKEDAYHG
ncbi:MAG: citrate lyase acyl carrier protein [Oscillibacter sp.]|nr:citrate lyase acyl carrier protein [Oscillibacter sp.]